MKVVDFHCDVLCKLLIDEELTFQGSKPGTFRCYIRASEGSRNCSADIRDLYSAIYERKIRAYFGERGSLSPNGIIVRGHDLGKNGSGFRRLYTGWKNRSAFVAGRRRWTSRSNVSASDHCID